MERTLPKTLAAATDPAWLTTALAEVTGGATVTGVDIVEVQRTMATKVRFVAHWDGSGKHEAGQGAFCLKAFLDMEAASSGAGTVGMTECDFYAEIAPKLTVRVPTPVATLVDRPGKHGVLIMRDLVAAGARFCTALEPLTADQAAASLDQLARLHAGHALLDRLPWLGHQVSVFAQGNFIAEPSLQELLDGPRGEGLDADTRSAGRLLSGLKALAEHDRSQPATLVHGDCHGGNLFHTADGFGLIDWQLLQRGNWALDVAYHIAAVLPIAVAEHEERRLFEEYLARARHHGSETPAFDAAWEQYARASVWGYFLWAITRRVDPAIINIFVNRLGSAVSRHQAYRRLGL